MTLIVAWRASVVRRQCSNGPLTVYPFSSASDVDIDSLCKDSMDSDVHLKDVEGVHYRLTGKLDRKGGYEREPRCKVSPVI